ncbi:MAG: site-specific DNA-methyltransferase, partial [Clostridia bacterium]|nr:site-specific DNA-methyltransferase [Clostridia bacterium]
MNFENMTKEELLKYIKELSEEQNGKYGLIWDKEKEPEEIVVNCDKYIPVLKEIKEKGVSNGGQTNLLIEGDNFHSLSVLNYTHKEQIDIIYIDPPYNTGNKDFVYNDKFIDIEDGYRHSKWLNFMEKRLKIARNLLKEDGMIFISIDDNELFQLKLLCDKIFGENNFINNIVVKSSEASGSKMSHIEKKFPKIKEYILIYGKTNNVQLNPTKIYKTDDSSSFLSYAKYYSKIVINIDDEPEKWITKSVKDFILENGIPFSSENEKIDFYTKYSERLIYRTSNKSFSNLKFETEFKRIKTSQGLERVWWEGKELLTLKNNLETSLCDLWADISTINLNKEGGVDFSNGKKPLKLIKGIINSSLKKDAVILDFFAGSGTTGEAVLQLNNEDSGQRRFILCTNNEG